MLVEELYVVVELSHTHHLSSLDTINSTRPILLLQINGANVVVNTIRCVRLCTIRHMLLVVGILCTPFVDLPCTDKSMLRSSIFDTLGVHYSTHASGRELTLHNQVDLLCTDRSAPLLGIQCVYIKVQSSRHLTSSGAKRSVLLVGTGGISSWLTIVSRRPQKQQQRQCTNCLEWHSLRQLRLRSETSGFGSLLA